MVELIKGWRFCTIGERLFVHYHNGTRRGRVQNHLYLVEIDPDRLLPIGPARELVLGEERRPVEKNGMLFVYEGELWAIYSIAPHVVLYVTLGTEAPVRCRRVYAHEWDVKLYATLPSVQLLFGLSISLRVNDRVI